MITENFNASEDNDPKVVNAENENASLMNADLTETEDAEEDIEEEDNDDEVDYTILPSNDSGITADDNAATGKMHEKEGE